MGLSNARRALVVDNNPWNRRRICDVLARKGYEVSACDTLGDARKFYRSHPIVVAGETEVEGEFAEFVDYVRESAGSAGGYVIRLASNGSGDVGDAGVGVDDVIGADVADEGLEVVVGKADEWLASHVATTADESDDIEIISNAAGDPAAEQKTNANESKVKTEIDTEISEMETAGGAISGVMLSEDDEQSVSIRRGNASRSAGAVSEDSSKVSVMPEKTTKYQYNLLIENAPLAMAMFDGEMRYLIANNRWRRHFDLEDSKVIGRGHFDIFSEVSDSWLALCEESTKEDREVVGEEYVEWPDGGTDWVRWTMTPWKNKGGEAGGLVVSCGVITKEKAKSGEQQFESGLAESLMGSGVTPLVVVDFDGRVVRCNRIARRWGDWGGASGEGRMFWDAFVPADDRQSMREAFNQHAMVMDEDGEFTFPPVSIETVRGDDGGVRQVAWTNTPRVGDGGVVTGLVRVGVEIQEEDLPTVEVPVEAELSEEAALELQDEWMDSFPLMCWRTNSRGKVKFFNRQWLDFRGSDALEECDNGWMDALHEEDYDSLIHAFDTAAKTGARVNHVARIIGGDGQYRWLRFVSARDFSDLEGASDGLIGYCEDLGRIIRLESELSAAKSRYDELLEDSTGAFKAKKALEARIVELEETLSAELKRVEGERDEALGQLNAKLQEAEEGRKVALVALEEERSRLEKEHSEALTKLEGERDEELQRLAEAKEAERKRLVEEREEAVSRLVEEKDAEAKRLVGRKDEELRQFVEKKDEEVSRLVEERQADASRLLKEKQEALIATEHELGDKLEAAELKLAKLRDRSQSEIESLRDELAKRVGELEAERDEKVAEQVHGFAALKADFDSASAEKERLAREVETEKERQQVRDAELVKLRKEVDVAQKAEAAAGAERDRFVTIPENAPFGMVLIARDGGVVYSNEATNDIAGVDFGKFEKVEDWLVAQAPSDDEEEREQLLALWRDGIWRQDGTKVLSMQTDKGLRELELKSKLLADGQVLLSMFDVTDSQRSEDALRASEVKFRSIFYDSGVGIALVDKTGNIFDANPAQEKLMGYKRSELRKMHIEDCLSLEEITRTQALSKEMAEKRARSGELTIKLQPKDKRPAWAHMNVSLVRDPDGEVIFAAYFFHDITKEREAISGEQAATASLESTQAEKRAIIEASPDLIVVVKPDGMVENVVPPVKFPLHIDQSMEGRQLAEVIPPIADDYPELAEQARKTDGVTTKEFSVKQGEDLLHFECRIARSGSENTVVVVRDITAAKAAEEATRRQALTFANIRDAIIVSDLKGRISEWNPAAEAMFGYSREEAIGMGLYMLYDREEPKRFKQTITAAIGKERKWEARTHFHRKDGSGGECEVRYTPLIDEGGRPSALVGVTRPAEVAAAPTAVVDGGGDSHAAHLRLQESVRSLVDVMAEQERSESLAPEIRAELGNNRARLEAVSLLHQTIEEGGNYGHVDFGAYVRKLVQYLLNECGPEHAAIEIHLNVKGIIIPVDAAQPLAIVLFELLSNSLRHAFARQTSGTVGVSMGIGADSGWMVVNDDGSGLPSSFNIASPPHGAGLKIAAQQVQHIHGEIVLVDAADTEIQVGFRLNGAT